MSTDHSGPRGFRPSRARRLTASTVAALLSVCAASAAQEAEKVYLQEDAVIAGEKMHTFSAGSEAVNVVLGSFSLIVGERSLSGRDAVVWVKQRHLRQQVFRDIDVYIRGDGQRPAQVVEPDGTTTTDRVLLVVLRQQGALRARVGRHSTEAALDLPLYQQAVAMRKGLEVPTRPTTRPAPEKPATRPAEPRPQPFGPVTWRADETSSKIVPDPRDPASKVRIWIAKGNVYLSQGDPKSDLFLSMRADAAVIYTDPRDEPRIEAAAVMGVYLEGDVVLRWGERNVRGEQLFYDFRQGRAIILQPVLRTIQEQRNIPVYIRAKEVRQTAAHPDPKEPRLRIRGYRWAFRDALVTTSDFHTPTYHIAAKRVHLEDTTPYDEKGVAVAPRSWRSRLVNATVNVRSIPLLWLPYLVGDAEEGHTALRKVQFGRHGRFGWGGESEWFLFRLLGLQRPEGVRGRLDADWYERGLLLGSKVSYRRENYSGYAVAHGMLDEQREDDFGTDRKNISARRERGRLLWRHKQFLPRDWQLQLETSYICDENFLEQFFPGEFWSGKDQETLLYAKKQKDNWALTGLAKWRINEFLTQTEALPDLAGYLVGQSLWNDTATLHGEGRLGLVRFRPAENSPEASSQIVGRADLRQELDLKLALGPVKLLPYVIGRVTYWEDTPRDQNLVRPWGQVGVNALMHVWRVYDDVRSRLWDLNRLKHIITPYGGVFWSCTSVEPDRLDPFSPDIEENVRRLGGATVGIRQLWQTKRGPAENQHTVDWLRANVSASLFNDADTLLPADGRYFFSRPEYSLPRNALNGDLTWHISDSTTFLGDINYDMDSGRLGKANAGIAVSRDPRMRYYAGMRYINALDSFVGTFGVNYEVTRKYTVGLFEQYDFDLEGGRNQSTNVTLIRKLPRWHVAVTFVYDRTQDDVGVVLSLWPEGIPEARIGGGRLSSFQGITQRD